jgi:hypothetical protein
VKIVSPGSTGKTGFEVWDPLQKNNNFVYIVAGSAYENNFLSALGSGVFLSNYLH